MKDHTGCKKGFHQLSRAWYGETIPSIYLDEFNIGLYDQEGGTTGEFKIVWKKLCGEYVPRLNAYDDSWDALYQFNDLLKYMASIDDQNVSPDAFCKKLIELGFEDLTRTEENS